MNDPQAQAGDLGALPAVRKGGSGSGARGRGLVRGERAAPAGRPSGCAEGEGASRVSLIVPIRTVSGLNVREHWRARSRRVKAERAATAWALKPMKRPALPCTVLLVRVGPSNGLDDDNLRGAGKGVRDEIAKWLGVDDRSPLVTWAYGQRRSKSWGIEVYFA